MAALHTRPLHYLNGHFYHPETGERVLLRDGAELVFTGHKQDFLLTDRAGSPYETSELRDVETMKRALANDPAVGSFGLLLPAGATLRFRLKPTKSPVPGAKPTDYTFVVRLDEPLFVSRPAVAGKGPNLGSLENCFCQVESAFETFGTASRHYADVVDRLRYFEPVYADSLNSLIKNTYVHYFQNAGHPGRSAFEAMTVDAENGMRLDAWRTEKFPLPKKTSI